MSDEKFVSVLYLLGFALIMGASIYFFAANWQWIPHWGKLLLSIALTLVFYGGAYIFNRKHPFLPHWLLFLGSCSFGVSVALVGQIYNSHADSYILFLIWSIPALILAIVTRYQPYYILSYILLTLTLHFYFFPTGLHYYYETTQRFGIFLLFFVLNSLLFYLVQTGRIQGTFFKYVSLLGVLGFGMFLTNVHAFEGYGQIASFAYLIVLGSLFYLTLKRWQDKGLASLTFIASAIYISYKFFDFIIQHGSQFIYIVILLFVPILIGVNIWFMRYLTKSRTIKVDEHELLIGQKRPLIKLKEYLQRALVGIISTIASIFTTVAIFGLISTIGGLSGETINVAFFIGIILLFSSLLLAVKKANPTVVYSLQLTGFCVSFPAAIVEGSLTQAFIYLGLVTATWFFARRAPMKVVTHAFLMLALYIYALYFQGELFGYNVYENAHDLILISLVLINLVCLWVSEKNLKRLGSPYLSIPSLFFVQFYFLILTNVRAELDVIYFIVNAAYFIGATWAVLYFLKQDKKWLYRLSLTAWFIFLVLKYHEFLWELLHKSLTLLILGGLVLILAWYKDRAGDRPLVQESLLNRKSLLVLGIIVLQIMLLGYQIGKSEYQLAHGTVIKLELAPIDPRSLIQGDYVILDYHVADVSQFLAAELVRNERVEVVLRPGENGIYHAAGYYNYRGAWNQAYHPLEGDIIIRGKYNGYNRIYYGIEHFFVQENTGRDLEQNARFAYVNVAQNGDAILLRVVDQ